jgi:hypothetical protein
MTSFSLSSLFVTTGLPNPSGTSLPPNLDYQIIPCTDQPYQTIQIALGNQPCVIRIYTKSINVAIQPPNTIVTDPPAYENINPVFIDLYVNDTLIIGGVIAYDANKIVRNSYLGFVGDITISDTTGAGQAPYGVPARLPPLDLRNWWQRNMPGFMGGQYAPVGVAGLIPGLGSRWLLTYWPNS